MGNPVKGETPLVLADGREFTLVLDMEAMLTVEDATDRPLPVVMKRAAAGFMGDTIALAHAAFTRLHPDVTRQDVTAIMGSDAEALTAALSKAAELAFPQAQEGNGPAPAKKAHHGKNSGRSGAKRG